MRLEGAAGGRRGACFERVLAARRAAEVLLDAQQVVLAALDDREHKSTYCIVEATVPLQRYVATTRLLERELPGVRLVLAAMGPKMCAFAGAEWDGVFFNWMTPGFAAGAREHVESGAREGMHTLERSIKTLVEQGLVGDEALRETSSNLLRSAAPDGEPRKRSGARRWFGR